MRIKRILLLILPVIILVCFTGCGSKECKMNVTINASGRSEDDDTADSMDIKEFTVKKGQAFYENTPGEISTEGSDSNKMLFKIVDIDNEGVTITYQTGNSKQKGKLGYGVMEFIHSKHEGNDGINYTFKIQFEKTE